MAVAAPTTDFRIRFFASDANDLLNVILQDTTMPPNRRSAGRFCCSWGAGILEHDQLSDDPG